MMSNWLQGKVERMESIRVFPPLFSKVLVPWNGFVNMVGCFPTQQPTKMFPAIVIVHGNH